MSGYRTPHRTIPQVGDGARFAEGTLVPSLPHEAPLEVLRAEPALVAVLLREALGIELPSFETAETSDADFSQTLPAAFRADLVVTLRDAAKQPVLSVVVEIQRKRDQGKRRTWPLYLAALHARVSTPTCLLVIATDDRVARWASKPITTFQPGSLFIPLVVGPSRVPRVSSDRARREPHLAVLSALVHGNSPGGIEIAVAAIDAVSGFRDDHARLFFDLILSALSDAKRAVLEAEMQTGKYEYKSDFARKYFDAGREEGREEGRLETLRTSLLAVAVRRVPALSDELRRRIAASSDVDRLTSTLVDVGAALDAAAIERLLAEL
jgi:hypothetical protein